MSSKEKLNRAYLETKVNKILEPLVVQLVANKPAEPVRNDFNFVGGFHDQMAEGEPRE